MNLLRRVLSRENLLAVIICLLLVLLTVMSAETAPLWIYQGF